MVQNGPLRGRSLRQMEKHLLPLPLPSAPKLAPRRSRDIIFAGGGGGGEKRRCGCGGVVAVLVAVLVAAYRLPALIGSYRARALALQSLLIDTLGRVVM